MANRFLTKGKTNAGQQPLSSGYPDSNSVSDFRVPPVGIEDIDTALFALFDKELPLQVSTTGTTEMKRVPVIFAGGEKWAMIKKNRPLRDKSNTLILPLITIGRTGIAQTPNEDMIGRGINQKTGEITIKRRLDKSDRSYQNLINKTFLKGQSNLAITPLESSGDQLFTNREIGNQRTDPVVIDGGLLSGAKAKHINNRINS
jgi:hypothetical protein